MNGTPQHTQKTVARNGVLCAVLVILAITAAYPVAEMGFIDDFSYIKTAEVFARTGHLLYNGWATAMLGWTVPWGALFLKIFGFSFTAARLSTWPLAGACVALFHASLRRFGIGPRDAVVGALTLGLSPLFLPMAASYMTDIAGLFAILVTLYLCQLAAGSETDRETVAWLAAASLANVGLGTARQISWLGALVMVPAAAYLLRKRRGVAAAGTVLWLLSVIAIAGCMHWFSQQPFSLGEPILQAAVTPKRLAHMLAELLKAALCLLLVVLPLTLAWASTWKQLRSRSRMRIAAVLGLLAAAAIVLARRGQLEHRVMPWLGHVIGTLSIFPSTGEMLGGRVATITMPMRVALSLVVVGAALLVVEQVRSRRRQEPAGAPETVAREPLLLLGPFSAAYVVFLMPRGMYSFLYDRYLLGLMPAAIVALLLAHRRWVAPRLPAVSVVTLAIFAGYTVAATHDWFALNRARVAAVNKVRATGVPVTAIQGGFDFDGWTQIEAMGYINDARIQKPAGAFQPNLRARRLPDQCRLNFAEYTPAIDPEFFVVFEPMPCLGSSAFRPVEYRTWLPPFRRRIYIQRAPAELRWATIP